MQNLCFEWWVKGEKEEHILLEVAQDISSILAMGLKAADGGKSRDKTIGKDKRLGSCVPSYFSYQLRLVSSVLDNKYIVRIPN